MMSLHVSSCTSIDSAAISLSWSIGVKEGCESSGFLRLGMELKTA